MTEKMPKMILKHGPSRGRHHIPENHQLEKQGTQYIRMAETSGTSEDPP